MPLTRRRVRSYHTAPVVDGGGSGATFASSTFTAPDNTILTGNVVAELGGTWTAAGTGANSATRVWSNRAFCYAGAGSNPIILPATPPSADYAAEVDAVVLSQVGFSRVAVRVQNLAQAFAPRIAAGFNFTTGTWSIYRGTQGQETFIDSAVAPAPSVGTHRWRVEAQGTTVRLYQDGTLVHAATDPLFVASAGFAGVDLGEADGDTTGGVHFDNFDAMGL